MPVTVGARVATSWSRPWASTVESRLSPASRSRLRLHPSGSWEVPPAGAASPRSPRSHPARSPERKRRAARADRRQARPQEHRRRLPVPLPSRDAALEHGRELEIVLRGEAVELQVLAALDVRLALRDLLRRDPRSREHLHQVGSREKLDRACIGDLVDATTHEQEAGERPRCRMLDHLVDLQLSISGTRLQEEVVGEVLDQVAGREHVVAVPGAALRVLRQSALAADRK